MSSWQLPVASDLIDRVLGEIFGPIISRLIRRDIHQLRRLDSLVAVLLFSALKLPKKNFLLNGGGCGRINLYTLLVSRLVSSTLRISADPAGEGEALAVIARLHPNSPMPAEEKKRKEGKP
jgi:hypothetical protein